MKIQVRIIIGGQTVKEDYIDIADEKLIPLTRDEIEESVEIRIRDWMDKHLEVSWEALDEAGEPISWEQMEEWAEEDA